MGILWSNYGYFDLGPVQVPPLPPRVGMTDRATGKVWYLGTDSNSGSRVVLFDTLGAPDKNLALVYGPLDGPYLQGANYYIRLGVQNGRMVYERLSQTPGTGSPGDMTASPAARDIALPTVIYSLQQSPTAVPNYEGGGVRLSYTLQVI